jgi:hypothetical protein
MELTNLEGGRWRGTGNNKNHEFYWIVKKERDPEV